MRSSTSHGNATVAIPFAIPASAVAVSRARNGHRRRRPRGAPLISRGRRRVRDELGRASRPRARRSKNSSVIMMPTSGITAADTTSPIRFADKTEISVLSRTNAPTSGPTSNAAATMQRRERAHPPEVPPDELLAPPDRGARVEVLDHTRRKGDGGAAEIPDRDRETDDRRREKQRDPGHAEEDAGQRPCVVERALIGAHRSDPLFAEAERADATAVAATASPRTATSIAASTRA